MVVMVQCSHMIVLGPLCCISFAHKCDVCETFCIALLDYMVLQTGTQGVRICMHVRLISPNERAMREHTLYPCLSV